jgi:hypothetical protein
MNALRAATRRLFAKDPAVASRRTDVLVSLAAVLALLAGAEWRYVRIFTSHDPRKYLFADMGAYLELARNLADPSHVLGRSDMMFPPGLPAVLGFFLARDPSLAWAIRFQFVLCLLVPLSVAALAYVAFGKTTAKIALAGSSLYFPFVDYGTYFLTEIYLLVLIPATLALGIVAARLRRQPAIFVAAAAVGLLVSVGVSFKLLVLPALFPFFVVLLFAHRRAALAFACGALVGLMPLTVYMGERCTHANEGHACLVSNRSGAEFLGGHFGRIGMIEWDDPKTGTALTFGSPASYQHGLTETKVVHFSITDTERNKAEAWSWIREHKADALVLSLSHVDDMFETRPWPSVSNDWSTIEVFHYVFLIFILLPCVLALYDVVRERGFVRLLVSYELLLVAPLFGLAATVFIGAGEARYRVPFDTLLLIVAAEFFARRARGSAVRVGREDALRAGAGSERPDDTALGTAVEAAS